MFAAPGRSRPFSSSPPRASATAEEVLPRAVSEPDPSSVWHRFRTEVRRAVSESTWHIWLERVSFRELAGTTLVVEAPDDVRTWVETRFGRLLTPARRRVLGPGARVAIVGDPRPSSAERAAARAERAAPPRSSTRG